MTPHAHHLHHLHLVHVSHVAYDHHVINVGIVAGAVMIATWLTFMLALRYWPAAQIPAPPPPIFTPPPLPPPIVNPRADITSVREIEIDGMTFADWPVTTDHNN